MIGFEEFFAAVKPGATAYPWQIRFAEACALDAPPPLVAVPTGAGKTTVLDALVWALAAQAERPAHERTVGCRTVWAIDRRILVDEVHEWAAELAKRLRAALDDPSHALNPVATALQSLAGKNQPPLVATRWRGGIADEQPLLSPTQPEVITSTVAQIGSRLLFRGYGVGPRTLKLQAGLAACDTSICLDEAHLAQPFVETVEAIRKSRARHEVDIALPPLTAVTLTATPPPSTNGAIELEGEDRVALGKRLAAPKVARLDDTARTERERSAKIAELAVSSLKGGARRVACVVNTVRQAIAVHSTLYKQSKDADWDLVLLIGPQRPVDREEILMGPAAPLFSRTQEEEAKPERPLVCVATQTFEVGLDADVDALVTESASASALVQRLGRLNRRGESEGHATIVRDPGSWLYGEDEELAWQWLLSRQNEKGQIDVSVAALEADKTRPVPQARSLAPELTDETVDLLVQTNPLPGAFQDPDVEPFLSGVDSEPASDVTICWRCDLRFDDADHTYREDLLAQAPPVASERLAISLRGARMLLAALHPGRSTNRKTALQAAVAEPDVEGPTTDSKLPPLAPDAKARFVVLRRGKALEGVLDGGTPDAVSPSQLAPGDTIVLPSQMSVAVSDPKVQWLTRESTRDSAPDVRPQATEPMVVRISPEAFGAARGNDDPPNDLSATRWRGIAAMCHGAEEGTADAGHNAVSELARRFPHYKALTKLVETAEDGSELRFAMVGTVSADADELFPVEEEPGVISEDEESYELPEPAPDDPPAEWSGPTWVVRAVPSKERDRRQRTPQDVPKLAEHAEAVAARVSSYCRRLGMDGSLAATLELAAKAHDHGKADRRIQDFYRGGAASIAEAPIAKSVFGTDDRAAGRRAAERAGLPNGLHHEIASAAILLDAVTRDLDLCGSGVDLSLAAYLVRGHHGRGQPFPVVPVDGDPPSGVFVDTLGISGSARGDGIEDWGSGKPLEQFWEVTRRYGAWGSAYLLAILMTADRTISSEGH